MVLSRQIGLWVSTRPLTRWTPPAVSWTAGGWSGTLRHRAWRSVHPATYQELKDIIAILGMDELSEEANWW